MRIIEHEQRSPEWFAARRGIFTASQIGMWAAEPYQICLNVSELRDLLSSQGIALKSGLRRDELIGLLAGSENYRQLVPAAQEAIDKTLGEAADGDDRPPDYDTFWTARGTRMEPEVVKAYEAKTGFTVSPIGFCIHDSGFFGASPDGLIDGSHSIEIKCPEGKTHLKYLRANVLPSEYYPQVHCQLAVTGLPFVDFFSYHPNLPPLLVRTFRDEFTDALEAGLIAVGQEMRKQEKQLAKAWRDEFER